ncbi:MAG: hypothetical protein CMO81_10245 [Waddliaceae bacterium]|nr:hypothetical protein [Waddliaceae bacterium]
MKDLNIKWRLRILVAVPIIAFLLFASFVLNHMWNVYSQSKKENLNILASLHISELILGLQEERGASAGLLSDRKNRSLTEIGISRRAVDDVLSELHNVAVSMLSIGENSDINRAILQEERIKVLRKQVDTGTITASAVLASYESVIHVLLGIIKRLSLAQNVEGLKTTSLAPLMEQVEVHALERGILYSIANGTEGNEERLTISELHKSHHNLEYVTNKFLDEVLPTTINTYKSIAMGASYLENEKLTKKIFDDGDGEIEKRIRDIGPTIIWETKTAYIRSIKEVFDKISENFIVLMASRQEEAYKYAIFTVITTFLVLVIVFTLTILNINALSKPLRDVVTVVGRIADKKLNIVVPHTDRLDEVGDVSRAIQKMVDNLNELTQEIVSGTQLITETSSELLDSVSETANTSSDTATGINEVSVNIHQLTASFQAIKEMAESVNELAKSSVSVSQRGEQTVQETVSSIEGIQRRMSNVGQSISELSQKMTDIGEIIESVNKLSEQSNLLAVNAAIEASKVGEQGRGFSVVAGEMKVLSDQSSQATIRVKKILNEIQQLTSSVVMAMEKSDKTVEDSIVNAQTASQSFKDLFVCVQETADAMGQIYRSTDEQLDGVSQVMEAIQSIGAASEQNKENTRYVQNANTKLYDLGVNLKGLVSTYELN